MCWVMRLGFRRHRRGYCMECQGTEACWEQLSPFPCFAVSTFVLLYAVSAVSAPQRSTTTT